MFPPDKSIGRPVESHRRFPIRSNLTPTAANHGESHAPKAVSRGPAALDREEERLESLPRQRCGPRLTGQPAVQGPPQNGPRLTGELCQLKRSPGTEGVKALERRLQRGVVLLSNSRESAAPAKASRCAASTHAGKTVRRMRLRKTSCALLASSRHEAPADRRASATMRLGTVSSGRRCTRLRGSDWTGRGAESPPAPLPGPAA
jgi:hypothetical protein